MMMVMVIHNLYSNTLIEMPICPVFFGAPEVTENLYREFLTLILECSALSQVTQVHLTGDRTCQSYLFFLMVIEMDNICLCGMQS